jgi:hypothetical protein
MSDEARLNEQKACPSGPCQEGALLIGVMTEQGTLAYVQPPTRVNAEFVSRARALGRPERRFRFSVPCIEAGCPQWTGKGCAVVDHVLEEEGPAEAPSSAELPRCAIRSSCRWFAQRGAEACAVCPLVVADIGGTETYSSIKGREASPAVPE